MSVVQAEKTKLSLNHFASVHQLMEEHGDNSNAEKIIELYEKYQKSQLHICFAGHFSAGKSSLINYLLNKDVLPKSPIPTSANIVKITSGEGVARVFFKDAPPVQYEEPYDIDLIKDYCMDRSTIKQIEIAMKNKILPAHCALLDTPGIDAADDADRLMTESTLHLIDVLFYVMDYNHVQSEVNLYFLKQMDEAGIPIYLIINQIDKHNEDELSFSSYKQLIKQTFDQWGIYPKDIYFTSMFDKHHPDNEIKQIKADIFQLMETKKVSDIEINRSVHAVIRDHQQFIREQQTETTKSPVSDGRSVEQELTKLQTQQQQLVEKEAALKMHFYEEVQTTLKNAYLMPATLRDLAGTFLTSQEKNFKVGFFQAKKKTEQEKSDRLNAFQQALKQTYETTIQWKIREKTLSLLQEAEITDPDVLKTVQRFAITFDEQDICSFLNKGATVNGNYILNYTNEISQAVKTKFRAQANELWSIIEKSAKEKFRPEKQKLETKHAEYEKQQAIFEEQVRKSEKIREQSAAVIERWENPRETTDFEAFNQQLVKRMQIQTEVAPISITAADKNEVANQEVQHENQPEKPKEIGSMTETIDKVIAEISDMSAFSSLVHDLKTKKDRLENRELTIALFGTFSAGKSSFSNALFGERILPVSPNPTTAVISRIRPVTEMHGHGTVLITMKSEKALIEDLMMITKHLHPQCVTLKDWVSWIEQNHIYEHDELTSTFQAYLRAIVAGYSGQNNHIGETVKMNVEAFAELITNETKACYIQHVDLYYDCSITQKGITLVDTPGADSVNARHTSVAFDYIKEADAILYVTYYNHAITSGDRDFLMQLGRVKEAFAMDKMFFIVNASDLAESEEDLNLVVRHVDDQLIHFGIRQANIYPVSSKVSLEQKLLGMPLNEEMAHFEQAFFKFIDEDLIALTVESAIWEMNRVKTALNQFIRTSELDESVRESKINELNAQFNESLNAIEKLDKTVYTTRLTDRIDRQLHFVLDRLYIRFHEMFTTHFNPSTIHASGRKAIDQLEHQRNQFVDYVGYELLQEIRAVAIRIESYMTHLVNEAYTIHQQDVLELNDAFTLPSLEKLAFETPVFRQAFEEIDMNVFRQALKVFKNTKSFFEQNEREKMKELFYDCLQPFIEAYLAESKNNMHQAYNQQWVRQLEELQNKAIEELTVLVNEHIHLMTTAVDVDELKEKQYRITSLLKENE